MRSPRRVTFASHRSCGTGTTFCADKDDVVETYFGDDGYHNCEQVKTMLRVGIQDHPSPAGVGCAYTASLMSNDRQTGNARGYPASVADMCGCSCPCADDDAVAMKFTNFTCAYIAKVLRPPRFLRSPPCW